MLQELKVVICDACGEVAKAELGGHHQRDEVWVAPDGWSIDKNVGNVHFCPKCTRRLAGIDGLAVKPVTYRSNAEEF